MKRPKKADSETLLANALGPSQVLWSQLVNEVSAQFAPFKLEWKPSKLEFGSVCLLKQKDRTLVYLIPGKGQFEVSIVLGNRAAALALEGDLTPKTKRLISQARVYAEGRGVRFSIGCSGDVAEAIQLVRYKTTPR